MTASLYSNYLDIGDEGCRIDTRAIECELSSGVLAVREALELPPSYCCPYANSLRNSAVGESLVPCLQGRPEVKMLGDTLILELYKCSAGLIAKTSRAWGVLDSDTMALLPSETSTARTSPVWCGTRVLAVADDTVRIFNHKGVLQNKVGILLPRERRILEASVAGPRVVLAGFVSYPGIPDDHSPFLFVESFSLAQLSPPDEDSGIQDALDLKSLGIESDGVWYPLVLGDTIVQPFDEGLVVASVDLTPVRVITGLENLLCASAGSDGLLHIISEVDNGAVLSVSDIYGHMAWRVELSSMLGAPVCPPIVSLDRTVYCVGRSQVSAYSSTGVHIDDIAIAGSPATSVHALLYADALVVSHGTFVTIISTDTMASESTAIPARATTPAIHVRPNRLLVGTERGLCGIDFVTG